MSYRPIVKYREPIIRAAGFALTDVPEDGFTEEGLTVFGEYPERGNVYYAYGEYPRTFIAWPTEAACETARRAIDADYKLNRNQL